MTTARQALFPTLRFAFPPAELSPNARVLWPAKHRATKAYREDCGWQAKAQVSPGTTLIAPVKATTTFYVRDRKRRDLDNLMARLKPLWDGIVDAGLLEDDSAEHLRHGEPALVVERESPARVEVVLEEIAS
jgi:crossover junction endodeoxyribonuclease RusA